MIDREIALCFAPPVPIVMHLSRAQFEALDATALDHLIERRLPEDHYLDYKRFTGRSPDGNESVTTKLNGDDKKEFTKDLIGFANASGGMLVIGYGEPPKDGSAPAPFFGVVNGASLQQTLENVAASHCDPPIAGLLMRTIAVEAGKFAVLCFVPPSASPPHAGHSRYYRRGSESTLPMDTSEVRRSVLDSYNRRLEIETTLMKNEAELVRYWLPSSIVHPGRSPGFVLQAIPLRSPHPLWKVNSEPFIEAVRGIERMHTLSDDHSLYCNSAPYVGIRSLQGDDQRTASANRWHVEVHASGLMCAAVPNRDTDDSRVELWLDDVNFFYAFGQFVDACLAASGDGERAVALKVTYREASLTGFRTGSGRAASTRRDHFDFPPEVTEIEHDATTTMAQYAEMLFHAYGLKVGGEHRRHFPWKDEID